MPLPFPSKSIPKSINPCPIIDASVEIRFVPNVPTGAVFGILFSEFQNDFPEIEPLLPFQQIPDEIRISDPNLTFHPHYRIKSKNYIIQIGPQVVSIGCIGNYPGWTEYSQVIRNIFEKVKEKGIADNILRIGLRYINFFPQSDIFKQLDVELVNNNSLLIGHNSLVRVELEDSGLKHTVQIGNKGLFNRNDQQVIGSFIDIDSSNDILPSNISENFLNIIYEQVTKLHDSEKKIFFGLLSDDYISTLNPKA